MAALPKNKRRAPKLFGQFGSQIITGLLILMAVVAIYSWLAEGKTKTPVISLSELANDINAGQVKSITVSGDDLTISLKDSTTTLKAQKESDSSLSQTLINYGVSKEKLATTSLVIESPSGWDVWLFNLLPLLVPIIFVLILFWFISRQVRGASMQAFTFGQSRARVIDPNDTSQRVTFKDVAGVREAKEELLEIVDFLKNPKKFLEIGARIPKGVVLMGAPGTGKTLLARAVAGEAKVPFFYLSGSEFVEMFVGVGASRVRDLFRLAKRAAPSIIFIDEIDAIGRHRGSGMGGGNDEREQTLNQILVEMDGFEPNEKLIVMAATNRPDVLDPALLRPGRFDRRVVLDQPDLKDREEILKIHSVKKLMGEDVNLHVIAERTPGFTGADLANAMNEAAILAAREDRKKITQYDLLRSIEKVMLGPERRSHILSAKEKKITAYHEMGHAILASVLEYADPVHKVSIISRGHAAGYTLKLPLEERRLQSRKEFLDDLVVSLGGYSAEEMIFNDVTTGASNDIQVATALARDMVAKYGMSEKVGPIALGAVGSKITFGNTPSWQEETASESTAALIDSEVSHLMTEALKRARATLKLHKKALDNMTKELMKVETLERDDFDKLLILNGIKPKKIEKGEGELLIVPPIT